MKLKKTLNRILFLVVHHFVKVIVWLWYRIVHFAGVVDSKNIPSKGGFIVAANHASNYDPPLIGISTWRRTFHYMAKDTLFNPPLGFLLGWMGAIPVKRGAVDRNAWDNVIDTVKEGQIVALFPEGTRTLDGEIHEGKAGTGMLVYKSRCQVIPLYIHGNYRAWKKGQLLPTPFTRMVMVFGKPMSFEDEFKMEEKKETYILITKKIMDEIKRLKAEYITGLEQKKK